MLGNLVAGEQTQKRSTVKYINIKKQKTEKEATWQHFEDFPGCTFGPVGSLAASFALHIATASQANSPAVCRFAGGAALDVCGVLFPHLDLEQL